MSLHPDSWRSSYWRGTAVPSDDATGPAPLCGPPGNTRGSRHGIYSGLRDERTRPYSAGARTLFPQRRHQVYESAAWHGSVSRGRAAVQALYQVARERKTADMDTGAEGDDDDDDDDDDDCPERPAGWIPVRLWVSRAGVGMGKGGGYCLPAMLRCAVCGLVCVVYWGILLIADLIVIIAGCTEMRVGAGVGGGGARAVQCGRGSQWRGCGARRDGQWPGTARAQYGG
jgi:hypothetical protein